jgi:hypothetical protein
VPFQCGPGRYLGPHVAAPVDGLRPRDRGDTPASLLWFALYLAPDEGASIAEPMSSSSMNRSTFYRHLTDHAWAGAAVKVGRGRWRAARTGQAELGGAATSAASPMPLSLD